MNQEGAPSSGELYDPLFQIRGINGPEVTLEDLRAPRIQPYNGPHTR